MDKNLNHKDDSILILNLKNNPPVKTEKSNLTNIVFKFQILINLYTVQLNV